MELNFRKITLDDAPLIRSLLKDSDRRFCENAFGTMFCWNYAKICVLDDTFIWGDPQKKRFDLPVGKNVAGAIEALKKEYGEFTLCSLSKDDLKDFEGCEIEEHTKFFDYIYDAQALITLKGKKLAAKRNHINAFLADGEWHTEKITPAHRDVLIAFNKKWCENRCENAPDYLKHELCAAEVALNNFEALGLMGLMLYKNNELVAYSYGEPINHDTFCVHVEKADASVRGAYQMINREFAREFCGGYKYINREDDAGDEGVRKAKLSYCPTETGRKFKAQIK